MALQTNLDEEAWEYDPEFLRARAEMWTVLWLFLASLIWTISWSYLFGYRTLTADEAQNVSLVWGMPTWVFWGIFTPWLAIDVMAIWFCFVYLQDARTIDSEQLAATPDGGTAQATAPNSRQAPY